MSRHVRLFHLSALAGFALVTHVSACGEIDVACERDSDCATQDCLTAVCSNGTCLEPTVSDGWCFVDGECYLDGTATPTNQCRICDAAAINDALINKACDNGGVCEPTTGECAVPTPDAVSDADAAPDAQPDAVPDAEPDAVPDAQPDAVPDAQPDAVPDAQPDAVPDAQPDAVPDAQPDAVPDTTADGVVAGDTANDSTIADASPDAGADVPADITMDMSMEVTDATADADTAADSGPDATTSTCQSVGDPCATPGPDGPFVCVEGVCRLSCTSGYVGCTCMWYDEANGVAYCPPNFCDNFFDNDCGPNMNCLSAYGQNLCVATAGVPEGSACTSMNECLPGLACMQGVCSPPDCGTGADDPTCAAGQTCVTEDLAWGDYPQSFGRCLDTCDSSADCTGANEWCKPAFKNPAGTMINTCAEAGPGGPGAPCSVDAECDGDHVCSLFGECATVCDPTAPDTGCDAATPHCVQKIINDASGTPITITDFGACVDGCTPFTTPSDCPTGQWCSPFIESPSVGACIPVGSAVADEPCDGGANLCGENLLCGGVCIPVCESDAMCQSGEACLVALGFQTPTGGAFPLPLKTCVQEPLTCDYDADPQGCPDASSQFCFPGDFYNQTDDLCLDIGGNGTTSFPLQPGDLCDPVGIPCSGESICYPADESGELRCIEMCREQLPNDPFLTAGNSDCSDPGATCFPAFPPLKGGLCQGP